jgi:membrane-bound lytic murein transglycosylase MltF
MRGAEGPSAGGRPEFASSASSPIDPVDFVRGRPVVSAMLLGRFGPRALLLALIAAAVALVAPAEGAPPARTPTPPPAPREELTIDPAHAIEPWTGDFDAMIERRVIRVLTTQSKTFYFVDKAQQRGATYDAFRLFETDLNARLARQAKLKQKHLRVSVMFIPLGRDELIPALLAGKGDVAAANLTITDERRQQVDFSAPVYTGVTEVVVTAPQAPAFATADDLSGNEVFVRKSSSYYESLTALNRRFEEQKKPPVVIREAPEALENEDLIEMVNAGLVPAIVVDQHIATFWKQVFPGIKVNEGAVLRSGGEIAWAIRKNSPGLKEALDGFLARHPAGSQARNTILARYLKNARYVKNAASDAERRKFLRLIDFFKKYSDKYDVDWLLMAAQGYQESRLNQEARSPVGAIGVMQVMPATGKDLAVGDIAQTEPNIHAGVKYMRWMIDTYYGKEPMTNLDKALFSFASYNAGAGRVAGLRREAKRRGLDPNVWFHNVEYVAAEKIGAETVTYVSNIYKYYVAYTLIMQAREEREKAAKEMKPATR